MKFKFFVCLILVSILALPAFAAPPEKRAVSVRQSASLDSDTYIDVNKILMLVANNGAFATDLGGLLGKTDGLYYPFTSLSDIADGANDLTVVYASGLWVGAIDDATGDTLIAIAEYGFEYGPGPMVGGTFDPGASSDPTYKVYKLYKDSLRDNPNFDWLNWPSDQGAPIWEADTYDVDTTTVPWDSTLLGLAGEPKVLGDQMLWTVYNDADVSRHDQMSTAPLGVEIRQTTFGFNREDPLGHMVFVKLQVFNRGGKDLNDAYFSLWSDPDLGGAGDDYVGCDTFLSIGYCYNATNTDGSYGSSPPAVGYDFFQGPLIFTGDMADTALMWDFTKWPGYINQPLTSFAKYINGTDPHTATETYQYMSGLNAADGGVPYDNGYGIETKFFHAGDPVNPVKGVSDLDSDPADRRFMVTTGPIDFAAGDSTEIIAAIVVGRGSDRLTSVTAMKFYDQFAQDAYENSFVLPDPPAVPDVYVTEHSNQVVLEWGNESIEDHGDYPFEGYTISQSESAAGPWKRIANYDLNNGTGIIFDQVFDLADGVVVEKPVRFGSDSDVKYYISITDDALNGGKLANNSDYYFKVEAYSYDGDKTPKTLASASVVKATPQGFVADIEETMIFDEQLDVVHTGISDGIVTAIVVSPEQLTGDSYQVIFEDGFVDTIVNPEDITDTLFDPYVLWHLDNVTTGERMLEYQRNQTNDDVYQVVDGIQVKVAGPPPGFKSFQVVANGAGAIDPPESGAAPWYGFPVPTDVDPDGYPTDGQQVGDGSWLVTTGDDGGTNGGGTRGSYDAFITRTLRDDPARVAEVGIYDWEVRFTGDNATPGTGGSYCWEWATDGSSYWIPFEIWRIGIGTPDDPSDDVRCAPYIYGDGSQVFELSSYGSDADGTCGPGGCEHSISGGDNDPYTGDWLYWRMPVDDSPGEAGYQAFETAMLSDPVNFDDTGFRPIMDRWVFCNWNGGILPPFNQDMPEQGTVFRMLTGKPNAASDVFSFTAPAQEFGSASDDDLASVRAVPNPYKLFSDYDTNVFNRQIRFTNLPTSCTIKIFNLAGDLVKSLSKESDESWMFWDVETDNGIPVASGIYVYLVETAGGGQKIGKMAIFIEEEQLDTY